MRTITPESSPFTGKKADFLLAASLTHTCGIPGITQAGVPGKIALTPTLDAEYVSGGQVVSISEPAETETGIPTPGLLTRAVHTLVPFAALEILDLGMDVRPQGCNVHDFGIPSSPSIMDDKPFDAQAVFDKGRAFGRSYKLTGDYLVIGESTPGGTTTAQAAMRALHVDTDGLFASSFRDVPVAVKTAAIETALGKLTGRMTVFEKLGHTADNTLMFVAGFVLEASRRFEVVLGGGTQMAAALIIADRLAARGMIAHDPRHISLHTTRWIAQDGKSDIDTLLDKLNFSVKAGYADFLYSDSEIPVLKRYDDGEAKEGVGAGAAIAYAYAHGITQKQITAQVETLMDAFSKTEAISSRK